MSSKYIDVMDTTFTRGDISSIAAIESKKLLNALNIAKESSVTHFEIMTPELFNAFVKNNKNPFGILNKFREILGEEVNLQITSNSLNMLSSNALSEELVQLFVGLFAKYDITTVRNYDPLNDIDNLNYSSYEIKNGYLMNEIAINLLDFPASYGQTFSADYYKNLINKILDDYIEFDAITFIDPIGTMSPAKIYEIISAVRELMGDEVYLRISCSNSAGVAIANYLSALEAGIDGLDLAILPMGCENLEPDMLSLLQATKYMDYNIGDLDIKKVLECHKALKDELSTIYKPADSSYLASQILETPIIECGKNETLDAKKLQNVIENAGYATAVGEIKNCYLRQYNNNIEHGDWVKIDKEYGRLLLGYYGKTPVVQNPEISDIAQEQLNLDPVTKPLLEELDTKELNYYQKILKLSNLKISYENIAISTLI